MQSVEQLRDRLAEAMGWKRLKDLPTFWRRSKGKERDRNDHPVTLSLDWLAAHGLPEGWYWCEVKQNPWSKSSPWACDARRIEFTPPLPNGGWDRAANIVLELAPTELHARLAACVAAWNAQAERSGT